MAGLKINLFGEFEVRRGEEPIGPEEWGRQKTRSLLKLLLTRPGHVFSRDEILEALWPGVPPKSAEHSLRTTVGLLRRALEPDLERGPDSRYVLRVRHGYLFDRRADCEVDAWRFEEHWQKAGAAREAGDLDEAIEGYRKALGFVRGDFLEEDRYEEWAMEARQEWQERRIAALSGLSECLALRGRYAEAIEACNRALALDKYREELHRRLMLYHYCAGEQAVALRVYRGYAKMLGAELGVAASPELVRLKDRIEIRDVPGVDEVRRYPRPRRPLRFPYSLSRTRFVGRDAEYALLAERLREAMEGSGGAVAVEGEAGVGKTRLVEEFLGYARSRGVRVLWGRCYERELGPPLEPVMDAMEPLSTLEEVLPKIPGPEFGYHRQEAETHASSRVYQALAGELIRRSHGDDHEGLVLFVDDVQWADQATLDFLSYLAKRVSRESVLLIFTYRREDAPGFSGWFDRLAERRMASTVSLERLSEEDLSRILQSMSSRAFTELSLLANFLHRESEGNPFYAVEYLRWLIESGAVEIDRRRRISGLKSELLQENKLPSSVGSLIQARLGGLDEEARNLLELAAVVGRTFGFGLLCEAAGRKEAEAFHLIGPVMASGLVFETEEGTYHFSHDKLRQALYEGIAGFRRRELHLRVARVLEGTEGEPAELAHHYLRAKEWWKALENLVLAAKRAEDGTAWEAALESYSRALEIAKKLPGSEERRFELLAARERLLEHLDRREERMETVGEMFELASKDRSRLAEVHIRRIGALMALGDLEGATEAGREAIAIFRELGNKAGEARVRQEISYVRWVSRDYPGALEANFEALRIHRQLGNRRGEAMVAGNIAQVYRGVGDHEQALRWAEKAARIHHELEDKFGEDIRLSTIAAIHRERGDLESALHLNLKTFNEKVGAKNLIVAQHSTCGMLYLRLGDPEKALEHFQAATRLSREIGYTRDEGYSLMSVGVALERMGDPAGAVHAYRRAVELLDAERPTQGMPQATYEESGASEELSGKVDALTLLAELLHRSLDRPEAALSTYEAAEGVCRKLNDRRRLRKLLTSQAGLRWRTGQLKKSARDYEEALDLARKQEEPAPEAAALASLSVVYRDLGRLKESVRCGRAALKLLQNLSDPQAEAYVLSSLAESYGELEHYPSALSCLRRSLRLRRRIGDKEGEVGVLEDLARIYEDLGDPGRARACSEDAASRRAALAEGHVDVGTGRRA